jgi:hypothetical protein
MGLTDFKTNFSGGTRQNRFLISGTFPGGSFTKFHVKSTSVPGAGTKVLSYDYFGRKWHYPGEKDYGPWSFTVVDDWGNDTVNLWKAFQSWQNLINNHNTNISKEIKTGNTYKADDWSIQHLGINGEVTPAGAPIAPLKKFYLNGCWPRTISGIPFSMANTSKLNNFTVAIIFDSIAISQVTKENSGNLTL